jgi:TRAP-type C4-dicarboxylate transport system substrate-binding protein
MLDGQVNPIFAIEEMKFYEVNDYMIFAGQQQFTTTVVTNSDWYNSLPEERQQLIQETVKELADYIFKVQEEYNQERLEIIKEKKPDIKIIELTDAERDAFRERSKTLHDKYVEMTGPEGKEILDSLVKEFQEAEKSVSN